MQEKCKENKAVAEFTEGISGAVLAECAPPPWTPRWKARVQVWLSFVDWKGIGGGLEEEWRRIGGGLEEDWRRIGGGLEGDWRRIGGGLEEDWGKSKEYFHRFSLLFADIPRCSEMFVDVHRCS